MIKKYIISLYKKIIKNKNILIKILILILIIMINPIWSMWSITALAEEITEKLTEELSEEEREQEKIKGRKIFFIITGIIVIAIIIFKIYTGITEYSDAVENAHRQMDQEDLEVDLIEASYVEEARNETREVARERYRNIYNSKKQEDNEQ